MVAEGERGHMGRLRACSAASGWLGNTAATGPAAAAAAGGCPAVHNLLDRPRRGRIRCASGLSGLRGLLGMFFHHADKALMVRPSSGAAADAAASPAVCAAAAASAALVAFVLVGSSLSVSSLKEGPRMGANAVFCSVGKKPLEIERAERL